MKKTINVLLAILFITTSAFTQGVEMDFSDLHSYSIVESEIFSYDGSNDLSEHVGYILIDRGLGMYTFHMNCGSGYIYETDIKFILLDDGTYRVIRGRDTIGYMEADIHQNYYVYVKD
jgi:hypothetical protein